MEKLVFGSWRVIKERGSVRINVYHGDKETTTPWFFETDVKLAEDYQLLGLLKKEVVSPIDAEKNEHGVRYLKDYMSLVKTYDLKPREKRVSAVGTLFKD